MSFTYHFDPASPEGDLAGLTIIKDNAAVAVFVGEQAEAIHGLLTDALRGATVVANHTCSRIRELETALLDAQVRLKGAGMLGNQTDPVNAALPQVDEKGGA